MKSPEALLKRHIIVTQSEPEFFKDYALWLKEEFESKGYNVPVRMAPNFLLKLASFFDRRLTFLVPILGKKPIFDNSRLINSLNITPLDTKKAFIEMAYSMIERGFIEKRY